MWVDGSQVGRWIWCVDSRVNREHAVDGEGVGEWDVQRVDSNGNGLLRGKELLEERIRREVQGGRLSGGRDFFSIGVEEGGKAREGVDIRPFNEFKWSKSREVDGELDREVGILSKIKGREVYLDQEASAAARDGVFLIPLHAVLEVKGVSNGRWEGMGDLERGEEVEGSKFVVDG